MGLNDVCYCANCPDLDSEFIEATVSEGKIVPAFSQIQELFSLQEFDFKMEVDDETKGERRALVFHGKENGGTRTYTVRLTVDSDFIHYSTMSDWPDLYFPSKSMWHEIVTPYFISFLAAMGSSRSGGLLFESPWTMGD